MSGAHRVSATSAYLLAQATRIQGLDEIAISRQRLASLAENRHRHDA
jgi:hypothetical protein